MTRLAPPRLSATELFESTEVALAVTELPRYRSADEPDQIEVLSFLPGEQGEEACWALVPMDRPPDEYVPVDSRMAADVLMSHLRQWLLERGWQIQVHCYSKFRRWTLVDCLSAADGGGDRLDVDYPYGDDELAVLVASILAVNTIQ